VVEAARFDFSRLTADPWQIAPRPPAASMSFCRSASLLTSALMATERRDLLLKRLDGRWVSRVVDDDGGVPPR
jgi:hypothetical protein